MYSWILITFIVLGTGDVEWITSQTEFKTEEKCLVAKEHWDKATRTVEQYHNSYCVPVTKGSKWGVIK